MEITDIKAIGFFDLGEKEQKDYDNYIWTAVEETFLQERLRYGHFQTLNRIIEQIDWMVREFKEEEDYEM